MGNKYEVYSYRHIGTNPDRYEDVQIHGSESFIRAMIALCSEKRRTGRYVRLEWR